MGSLLVFTSFPCRLPKECIVNESEQEVITAILLLEMTEYPQSENLIETICDNLREISVGSASQVANGVNEANSTLYNLVPP